MKIVYPLLWPAPDRKACRAQSINTGAALARQGAKVTFVMPRRPGDPAVDADTLRDYFDVSGDFDVVQRPSRWAGEMAVPAALFLRRLLRDPILRGADLIYSRIPHFAAAGALSPLPFVFDHYRPWPDDWPILKPAIRRTAASERCLGFVLHSDFAAQSYRRIGVREDKLLVAHNGADLRLFSPPMTKREARARLGLDPERPIGVYAGRVNEQKGLDQLVALADLRPQVQLLVVGAEAETAIGREIASRPNMRLLPWQKPADLPAWLFAADLLLIPASKAPLERFGNCVLPIKLYQYLAAARPILAPIAPDTRELLRHEENALLVPPGDPVAAAAAFDRLIGDRSLAERLARNAGALGATLSWDARGERLMRFLERRLVRTLDRAVPAPAGSPGARAASPPAEPRSAA